MYDRPQRTGFGLVRPILILIAVMMATAGCGADAPRAGSRAESATPLPPDTPANLRPPDSIPSVVSDWTTTVTGAGVALVLDTGATELVRLSCSRDPATLELTLPTFTVIGSEERLSFGIDEEPFVFVADVTRTRGGVHATRAPDADFLQRLERARHLSAVYGTQLSGPHLPPDSATLATFTTACRRATGI